MDRRAVILRHLETALSASVEGLSFRLNVSPRTVASDIEHLNAALGSAGSVRLRDGRYRLLVVDEQRFQSVRTSLLTQSSSFNDLDRRTSYLAARLFRADIPLRAEELAAAMSVGRTTVTADLARLREQLASYTLGIEGRTHVGLRAIGPELEWRQFILQRAFDAAYGDYGLDEEIALDVAHTGDQRLLNPDTVANVLRWCTVMIDRHLNGHHLGPLPQRYADLAGTPAHDFAREVAQRVGRLLGEEFPPEEELFLSLPAAGMRTPGDVRALDGLIADDDTSALVTEILSEIGRELDVHMMPNELLREFVHHLAFMLNRLRYRIRLEQASPTEMGQRYPLAHTMATIAARVIARETGIDVVDSELGYMATYFQVFLEEYSSHQGRTLKIAIATGSGRASARLLQSQLERVFPRGTTFVPIAPSESADDFDVVITTAGQPVATSTTTVELREVFDGDELLRQVERLRYSPRVRTLGSSPASVLTSTLADWGFFSLPEGTGYPQALDIMLTSLEESGRLEREAAAAVREREARGTMRLDEFVAFPHVSSSTMHSILFALGVVPHLDDEPGIRAVFLMVLPHKNEFDDTVLIEAYDDIIRLASDRSLLTRLSRLHSYEQFFYFMENNFRPPEC